MGSDRIVNEHFALCTIYYFHLLNSSYLLPFTFVLCPITSWQSLPSELQRLKTNNGKWDVQKVRLQGNTQKHLVYCVYIAGRPTVYRWCCCTLLYTKHMLLVCENSFFSLKTNVCSISILFAKQHLWWRGVDLTETAHSLHRDVWLQTS